MEISKDQIERVISALERFVDAFEAGVANQSKIVEQTVKTMRMAQSMAENDLGM